MSMPWQQYGWPLCLLAGLRRGSGIVHVTFTVTGSVSDTVTVMLTVMLPVKSGLQMQPRLHYCHPENAISPA